MSKVRIFKLLLIFLGILYVTSLLVKSNSVKAYYSIFPMTKNEYVELKKESEEKFRKLMTASFYSEDRKDELLKLKEKLQLLKSEGEKNGYN